MSERLRSGLEKAGVLGELDPAHPPAPLEIVSSPWTGDKEIKECPSRSCAAGAQPEDLGVKWNDVYNRQHAAAAKSLRGRRLVV